MNQEIGTEPDDEGMAEDVDVQPRRSPLKALSLSEVLAPSEDGKGLPRGSAAAEDGEFISLRGPLGVTQITFSQYPIFAALWSLWAKRRGDGEESGVTAIEIAETFGVGQEMVQRVHSVLATLVKSQVVRKIAQSVGFTSVRTKYYPTELGISLFAFAETFGYGVAIQVGRNTRAWRGRNVDEPVGIFERAKLLKGRV